jgi:acetylornithine/succinyldiaminopimelate/putrescine aminotransferase
MFTALATSRRLAPRSRRAWRSSCPVSTAESFLTGLRKLADELGALLIVDEVQSSYGRTGPMFATDLAGVLPDIMLLGKAMGNGYPVSAMIARPEVCAKVRPDQFSSSHSGNPGGCAAALAVLDAFAAEDVLGAGKRLAELFASRLSAIAGQPRVVRVRQQGLAIGVELENANSAERSVSSLRSRGILLNSPIGRMGSVLRLAPALTMPPELAARALDTLEDVLMSELASESMSTVPPRMRPTSASEEGS